MVNGEENIIAFYGALGDIALLCLAMNLIDIALLFASVLVALATRSTMKRFLVRRVGRANAALLEIDFWKASSGEALVRGIVLVELASWVAIVLLVLQLAILVLK
jgi:hypothetical protein